LELFAHLIARLRAIRCAMTYKVDYSIRGLSAESTDSPGSLNISTFAAGPRFESCREGTSRPAAALNEGWIPGSVDTRRRTRTGRAKFLSVWQYRTGFTFRSRKM